MANFLVSWPGGNLEATLKLGGILLAAYALVLWFSAVVWVYRDVRNRTTDPISQTIAVLLVALFNLPGLIVYLVIRPHSTLSDAYEHSLETEAILHELQLTAASCQNCQYPVEDDYNVCPHCRAVLREPCRACGRAVRTTWVTCPYCATDRVQRSVPMGRVTTTEPLRPPPRRASFVNGGNNGSPSPSAGTAARPGIPGES